MNLNNCHIVLTGATGGLGRALALELAGQGAVLTLVGRDKASLQKMTEDLPGTHQSVVADLCSASDRDALVSFLDRRNLPIDILINNAGVSELCLLDTQGEDSIRRIFEINLLVPILLTRALMHLLVVERSQILNIGSTFGSIGYPGFATYSASKFGLRGFTEAIRREYSSQNIHVQYVAPRAIDTALNTEVVNSLNAKLGNKTDKPGSIARQICVFIQSDKTMLYVGWPEKIFVRINALFTGVVDKAIKAKLPVIKQTLQENQS